jgi:eukaryotic-like serine/threonine-protein kinase
MARGPMAEAPSLLGRTLGHYRILEKIGEGGMGEVYRAHDEHLDCDVAIKVLPLGSVSDESARKRFHKEARALSRLSHPCIAIVHDFDTQQGVDYLVMEYVSGTTLSEKLARGKLPEKEVIALGMQLAEGLCAAHEHGVIHSDLKPGNLRLSEDGRLKILDFGLAKLRPPGTATATTASFREAQGVAGTLPYMAPEQLLAGEVDTRTDIHAAGCVLYEMATGRRPFAELEPSKLISAILSRTPLSPVAINPTLSAELERIIGKCLEKEPENRYQSAKELGVDLRRLGRPSVVAAPRGTAPHPPLRKRTGVLLSLAGLLTIVVLLGWNIGRLHERVAGEEAAQQIRSIAVLPLTNFSGDTEQEYFSDGMTEALTTNLSQIKALRVISRTSAMHYKRTNKNLQEIARELNVDGVVEGSVMRAGNRVRITAQLIQTRTDQHLWAETYERDLGDVLKLQSEVAQAIVQHVRVQLTSKQQARLVSARTVNPQAYEAYLKGRFYRNTVSLSTQQAIQQAQSYFQLAVQKDPSFAPAYAGLADCYEMLGEFRQNPQDAYRQAKEAIRKALDLDETLGEAHSVLGTLSWRSDWDWNTAEKELTYAVELNPNLVDAHGALAVYLGWMGRRAEALTEIAKIRELDPDPIVALAYEITIYYHQRDFGTLLDAGRKYVALNKNAWSGHYFLATGHDGSGQHLDAIPEYQKAVELSQRETDPVVGLAHAYAAMGRRREAEKILHELHRQSKTTYVSPYMMAAVYAGLGEKDKAFLFLEEAYRERSSDLSWFLKADLRIDSLRSDPRFQDLLRRMNLPQ